MDDCNNCMENPDTPMINDCCKNESNHVFAEKFKDIITVQAGFSYTVYITYCKSCGSVIDAKTWIE
jgi:hypothetical protein